MDVKYELVEYGVEIVCLDGLMRILNGEFVRLWRGRIIKINKDMLKILKGNNDKRKEMEDGVRING
jgi:folate-dependent phosphoribosylglycinamide formyltransferase PurN